MHVTSEVIDRAVRTLQARLPDLLAVYGFGSRVQGTAGPDSDLDWWPAMPTSRCCGGSPVNSRTSQAALWICWTCVQRPR